MTTFRRRSGGQLFLFAVLVSVIVVFLPWRTWSAPKFEIKLATLAPENSSLMRIFRSMNDELLKESGGRLGFKMYAGFVLGNEADVLRKLRIGLVNAAVFTNTALTDVNPQLRVLQVPFLFDNYQEVDYILSYLQDDLRKGYAKKGFELLGLPELGFIYFMSKEPIVQLDGLKGKRVWAQPNAPMAQAFVEKVGVSSVAIAAPDVLMALQTNLLDVVYNSPYYALITQWYTQIKYVTDLPLSYIGGCLLIDSRSYAKLPPELQRLLKKTTAKYIKQLVEKTRKDNAEALRVMLSRGVIKVVPDAEQAKRFRELSNTVVANLDPKVLPQKTLKSVESKLAEFRASHSKKP